MLIALPTPVRWVLVLLLSILLWLGLQNRPDPIWQETAGIVQHDYPLIDEVPDSLQQLYCTFQRIPFQKSDKTALALVSRPYLSNIEWAAFRNLCRQGFKQKFMVVSGVTGAGATKQAVRMAYLIAGTPERMLEVDCAPQFDVEYHRKYIGRETEKGYEPGVLLRMWEDCRRDTGHNYVALFDNFDKINPETFFGPQLWESMSSPKDTAVIGGKKITIPPNFFLFSVTHLGPGATSDFNEEHFKRLGRQYILEPNILELQEHLRRQADKIAASGTTDTLELSRLAALRDTAQLHRFLFYFAKTNDLIRRRFADGYLLGQTSNIRNLYRKEDLPALKQVFINHINALHPERPFKESDFIALDYTVATRGLEQGSSFLARQAQFLQETGYLVEITMVLGTALITALAGWWVFRRREQLMRQYGEYTQNIFNAFENQTISAEAAARQLEDVKREVDQLVMQRKLNYTEGLYFLAFIEDKARRIEFARNVSENFLELFNTFMEDEVLTENEYQKLMQFLKSIRHKVPADLYEQFFAKVEQVYRVQS